MRKLIFPLVALLAMVLSLSVFQIQEGQRGIVIRFGRVIKDSKQITEVLKPGLHIKMPFIDSIKLLDVRIQTMDDQADRFVTSEKKDVIIDTYVKWKIDNFSKFYLSTGGGNVFTAEALLKRKVADGLRAEIGSKTIKDIVSAERDQVMQTVLAAARTSAQDLGIRIVDFRIKKINLPEEISESIYQRMRAERESIARKYRSEGREQAAKLKAQADLDVSKELANADRTARITRGEAEATAAKIYSNAYKQDPEFYNFMRSLQAYAKSFKSKNDIMVLSPDSEFFKYMQTDTIKAN